MDMHHIHAAMKGKQVSPALERERGEVGS